MRSVFLTAILLCLRFFSYANGIQVHEEESEEKPSPTPLLVQVATVNMTNAEIMPTFETVSVTPATTISPTPSDKNNQSNSGSYTQKAIFSRYFNRYSFFF